MDLKSTFFVVMTACVVFAICFILIRGRGASVYSVILKSLASFCFVLCFMSSLGFQEKFLPAYLGLGMGLVAGLIGDILLELKVFNKDDENEYLNAGFVSFGIGHFFYIFAIISLAGSVWKVNNVLAACGAGACLAILFTIITYFVTTKIMKLNFGKNLVITMAYSFILFFVTSLAVVLACINTAFISLAIGLILFTLSDLVLSQMYFGGKANNNTLQIINHTLYYLAQFVIASTLFFNLMF